jgi:hypothetical protein
MCTLVTLAQIIFRVQELAVQGSHVLLHGTALIAECGRVVVALSLDVLAQERVEDGWGDALLNAGGAAPRVGGGNVTKGRLQAVCVPASPWSNCCTPAWPLRAWQSRRRGWRDCRAGRA